MGYIVISVKDNASLNRHNYYFFKYTRFQYVVDFYSTVGVQ